MKIILFFISLFVSVNSFAQDNPMFDSLDYFVRNKIKTIHYNISPWYYSPPWHYVKMSFNKQNNTLKCDSIGFDDVNSPTAKYFSKTGKGRSFGFKDTIMLGEQGRYNDTVKHYFDTKGRITQIQVKSAEYKYGTGVATSNTGQSKNVNNEVIPIISNTFYFYFNDSTKKLKQIVTENKDYKKVRNYYYSQSLLSTQTEIDSNKIARQVGFETTFYDYYPDKKLKKETRRVSTENCPNICEGVIEYKYETEFPNDSTPSGINTVTYLPLLKIINISTQIISFEIYGYDKEKNIKQKLFLFNNSIKINDSYEVVFDDRPDYGIRPKNENTFIPYTKDKFKSFEILIYKKSENSTNSLIQKKDILHFEKCKVDKLFNTPKEILIK